MTDTPQMSGRDLARQALATARAAAKTAPTAAPKQRRTGPARRGGSGRDPMGLGAALQHIATEQGWDTGLAGGNILDQWATLCPQYADTVQPVAYDPERGRLDLRPTNYAVASGLRLLGGQLAKQINDKMGRPAVRSIRVLPVGAARPDTGDDTAAPTAAGPGPVRTRETASTGYRQTLDAHLAAKPDTPGASPHVLAARARQDAAITAPELREPAHHFTDGLAELERITTAVPDRTEAARSAAIARKRAEAAGTSLPRRAFD